MMVSCQCSSLCCCWSVVRPVIENQEIGFKKLGTDLQRVVGLHQSLAGNVITCLEQLLNGQCRFSSGVVVTLERNILLRLTSNCNWEKRTEIKPFILFTVICPFCVEKCFTHSKLHVTTWNGFRFFPSLRMIIVGGTLPSITTGPTALPRMLGSSQSPQICPM